MNKNYANLSESEMEVLKGSIYSDKEFFIRREDGNRLIVKYDDKEMMIFENGPKRYSWVEYVRKYFNVIKVENTSPN